MTTLKNSLLGNAVFSALTGMLLIFLHRSAADLFGVANSEVFWIIGLLLLPFALSVFVEARKKRLRNILFIILQDGLWVLGSAALLVLQPFNLSTTGYWIIAAVALVVLCFAVAQSIGIMRTDSGSDYRRKRLVFERGVPASKSDTWEVISEVSDYHNVAPNIDEVDILSGEGEGKGMVRRCAHGDEQWTETCTEWSEGDRFSFKVDTSAPDYPYPFSLFMGTWEAEEASSPADAGAGSSTIRMIFEFEYALGLHALLLHPFIRQKFDTVCTELFDNWEKRLKSDRPVKV